MDSHFALSSGSRFLVAAYRIALIWLFACSPLAAQGLVSSVLPTTRAVQVGDVATAFATLINTGETTAENCGIQIATSVASTFSYRTTDPATNIPIGTANTPVDIPPGGMQTFVFSMTPEVAFPVTEIELRASCRSGEVAPSFPGVNSLRLSASDTPSADLVALAATFGNDGIVAAPLGETGIFAVATSNVGSTEELVVSADTGSRKLPLSTLICATDAAKGTCTTPWSSSLKSRIAGNSFGSFAVLVTAKNNIAPDPGLNRLYVRFHNVAGAERGATSVAINTARSFELKGRIQTATSNVLDGDINRADAPYRPNDYPAHAQPIQDLATVGGYANVAKAGPSGRSYEQGDVEDYFRVDLPERRSVILHQGATPANNDLDLYLTDLTGTVIDASVGTSATEALNMEAGSYLLRVHAARGASTYVLTIGQGPAPAEEGMLRLSADFVPDRALVGFNEPPQATAQSDRTGGTLQNMAARLEGWSVRSGHEMRTMLLERLGASSEVRTLFEARGGARGEDPTAEQKALLLGQKLETLLAIKRLRRIPDIRYAEPDFMYQALRTPNDDRYAQQWHYRQIGLPRAWDETTGAPNVVVAVIDTGVLQNHPDLQGQLVKGYDFVSSPSIANDGDGIDPNPEDSGDVLPPQQPSYHGTHVTGTIAAASDNNRGVTGVVWGSKVMPLRALGVGGGTTYDINQAIRYAAGLANDSGGVPDQPADVINMSIGGPYPSQATRESIAEVREAGIIVIAAAGNEASNEPSYPAAYDGVISVSAVDLVREVTWYSNFGATIDVAAPGGDLSLDEDADGNADGILSTMGALNGNTLSYTYALYQGTSMAAPHVAGVAALMKSIHSKLTPEVFDKLLSSGSLTTDLGESGWDEAFGWGLIDAEAAVQVARELADQANPPKPHLEVEPGALNFGMTRESATLTASNTAGGTLSIKSVSNDSSDWLQVTPLATDSEGLGTYKVRVIRDGLADGYYSAHINFRSNANSVDIPVLLQVGEVREGGDAGPLYVLLLDWDTRARRYQTQSSAQDSRYTFNFEAIPAGTYLLTAGSDLDNDGVICEAGEACGHYPSLEEPKRLVIDDDRAGLNFDVNFVLSKQPVEGQRTYPVRLP